MGRIQETETQFSLCVRHSMARYKKSQEVDRRCCSAYLLESNLQLPIMKHWKRADELRQIPFGWCITPTSFLHSNCPPEYMHSTFLMVTGGTCDVMVLKPFRSVFGTYPTSCPFMRFLEVIIPCVHNALIIMMTIKSYIDFFLYGEFFFCLLFVVVCVTSTLEKSAIASGVRVGREVTCYIMKAKKNPVTILLRYILVDDFTTLMYQNVYSIASCFFIGNIQVHCRRWFYLNSWDCGVYRIYI